MTPTTATADDTTVTGPYVLARLTVTAAPQGYTNFIPFVCWGVYNTNTHKTLLKPEPSTLHNAIWDVLNSPHMARHYRALYGDNAPTDRAVTITIMDVSATGASASQITSSAVRGTFGHLRFTYADWQRAKKAQELCADVERLAERCEWALHTTTQIVEEDGETIPDLAPYLDMSVQTLRRAQQKAENYSATTALENLITTTQTNNPPLVF